MLERLWVTFGVDNTTLAWLRSYLSGLATRNAGHGLTQCRQVSRRHVVYTLIYTWTHSEPNPVIGIQPVKLASPELTQPSVVLACVGDDSGRSINAAARSISNARSLSVNRLLWCTDQETATVVDPAGDESLDESSGRVVVELGERRMRRSCRS